MRATFTYKIDIRFADIDVMGHVNNAVYFSYFEQARMGFFARHVGKWDWRKHGLIIARHEFDYRNPLHLHDEAFIETYPGHVGGKSFEMLYRVYKKTDEGEIRVGEGKSVLVCFDHTTGATQGIPAEWRRVMEA